MTIRRKLINELLKDYPNPQDGLTEDGLLKQLSKAVIERCLQHQLKEKNRPWIPIQGFTPVNHLHV